VSAVDLGAAAGPEHVAVAAAVLLAACVALYAPRRFVAVVGFLAFGAILSLYWGVIGAPDVALAEAAIGTGVTGALFVAAVTLLGRDGSVSPGGPWTTALSVLAGAALGAVIGLGLTRSAAVPSVDPDGPGLGSAVDAALPETGVSHPVTGVLLNLRSLDTLMEMVVLLAAVAVALAFLPTSGAEAGRMDPAGPILDRSVRLVAPFLLLLAAWLLVAGSTRPGGAFQSGAVLAATLILVHLGGVWTLRVRPMLLLSLAAGVTAFVLVAVGGVLTDGTWLLLRGPNAGTLILALEAVLAVTIGASLATVFLAASMRTDREAGAAR
jgi:multisubunit Na+/H+ antiporter MnhB subunit